MRKAINKGVYAISSKDISCVYVSPYAKAAIALFLSWGATLLLLLVAAQSAVM